jgi:hypothetical protein
MFYAKCAWEAVRARQLGWISSYRQHLLDPVPALDTIYWAARRDGNKGRLFPVVVNHKKGKWGG